MSPDDPCPCESGLPAMECCLTPNGFKCKPVLTDPPCPKTGLSRKGCYAASLCDCGSCLSREHFVSHSILRKIEDGNQCGVKISGFPWMDDECGRIFPPQALVSRVLCDRHNSALSGLDAVAERLFSALDEKNAAGSEQNLLYLFNGHDIERWLLKVLCGFASSGNLTFTRPITSDIPAGWIEVLFGIKNFEPGQGLYVCRTRGTKFEGPRGVAVSPVGRRSSLVGVILLVCGYELILVMSPPAERQLLNRQVVYRPMEFHVTGPAYEKSVVLCWEQLADLGTIHFEIC